jgi:hypothetical protein
LQELWEGESTVEKHLLHVLRVECIHDLESKSQLFLTLCLVWILPVAEHDLHLLVCHAAQNGRDSHVVLLLHALVHKLVEFVTLNLEAFLLDQWKQLRVLDLGHSLQEVRLLHLFFGTV